MHSTNEITTDVLIVGAGPAGLTTALALSDYGVDHVIVERHPATANSPRAHIVNQRTVEIMRHLGLEDAVRAVSMPQVLMADRLWFTTLNRPEVVRSEGWGTGIDQAPHYRHASPCVMLNCPQTDLEPALVDGLRSKGSDVHFHHELISTARVGDRYESLVKNRTTGSEHVIRSRFVVGADGARSKVMELAGLELSGHANLQHMVNIWFRADLSAYVSHRPGVPMVNVHPGENNPLGRGTLICCEPFHEFVLVRAYDPDHEDLSSLTVDDARRLVDLVAGEPVETEILGVSGWQVNAQFATELSRDGIFCVGDAIHRHPPTSGMGLNTSVADAFNLAWKLALACRGLADRRLLATYSSERQPVIRAMVERAVQSAVDARQMYTALGLQPGMAEEAGWKELAVLDDPGPAGDARRAAVIEAIRVTDYQVNGLNAELGYGYSIGALVLEQVPEPAAPLSADLEERIRSAVDYHPTTLPGRNLPHARLERGRDRISTLDLVDGLEFVLITGLGGAAWRGAVESARAELGVPLRFVMVGGPDVRDPYREWMARREVGHHGAVLVRPDRHVAWRSFHLPTDPASTLLDALRLVLHPPAQQPGPAAGATGDAAPSFDFRP